MVDNSNNIRIAKNTILLYLRMLLVLLVSLYTTRVVLNVLGVEDYGIYNVVAGFVSMFAFIKNAMTTSIQRFFNYEKGKNQGQNITLVFNVALQIQIVVGILSFVLLETIGLWYINNVMVLPETRLVAANFVFQASVLSLLLLVIEAPFMAAVLAFERMGFYAIVSIIEVVFKLLIVLALPYVSYDKLIFYGFLSLAVSTIELVLYYLYCKLVFKDFCIKILFDWKLFRSMLSFASYNTLDMLAYTAKNQGTNILTNYFFGPIVNAARGIASQVQGAIQGFSVNIVTSFRPQIVESYAKGDYLRTQTLMYSLSKVSYILLFLLCLPVVVNIDYILHLWLGNSVPEYAKVFVVLTLIDMVISSLNTPLSIVAQATGDIRFYQIVRSILIASVLLFSFIFLKLGAPATSVYWISIVLVVVNQPISLYLLKKVFDYEIKSYMWQVVFPCVMFSVFTPIIPLLLTRFLPKSFWGCSVSVVSCLITSSIIAYFICLNGRERDLIKKLVAKFKS